MSYSSPYKEVGLSARAEPRRKPRNQTAAGLKWGELALKKSERRRMRGKTHSCAVEPCGMLASEGNLFCGYHSTWGPDRAMGGRQLNPRITHANRRRLGI